MSHHSGVPLVSVLMNCYNCEAFLREAIESVYSQTYSNWELIFWDNASSDGSAEIAQSYDQRLRYFRGDETIPLGAARNRALEQVHGEYIAFLDSDDLWDAQKLERQVPLFADERVGLVYSDVISFNAQGDSRRVSTRKTLQRGTCFEELLLDYCIYMSSAVVRTEALNRDRIRFNESFAIVEEMDLFLRIALNWRVDFAPSPLAQWRVHSTSGVWSEYERMAIESEEMLRLFAADIPRFEERYQDAMERRRSWISRTRSLAQWRDGQQRHQLISK